MKIKLNKDKHGEQVIEFYAEDGTEAIELGIWLGSLSDYSRTGHLSGAGALAIVPVYHLLEYLFHSKSLM